jgi:hypothetical protein
MRCNYERNVGANFNNCKDDIYQKNVFDIQHFKLEENGFEVHEAP